MTIFFYYTIVSELWVQIDSSGVTPRDSHISVVVGDFIYIFGGSSDRRALNELLIFDTGIRSTLLLISQFFFSIQA